MVSFDDYTRLVGLPALREREQSYLDTAEGLSRQAIARAQDKKSA